MMLSWKVGDITSTSHSPACCSMVFIHPLACSSNTTRCSVDYNASDRENPLSPSRWTNPIQDVGCELRRIPLPRLSEKGRRCLRCNLTEHLNGTFRPILASLRLPNPRS